MKKVTVRLDDNSAKKYVERRDKFIDEFINNVQIEYRNDPLYRQLMDRAIDLTVVLQVAACDDISREFVANLLGFVQYCSMNKIERSSVLTTIYHDLNEFESNRNEDWFAPRSSGYSKYLSGVSGVPAI